MCANFLKNIYNPNILNLKIMFYDNHFFKQHQMTSLYFNYIITKQSLKARLEFMSIKDCPFWLETQLNPSIKLQKVD